MNDMPKIESHAPVAVKGGVVPYLLVDGAAKAAEFYKRAFGAEIAAMLPPDDQGRTCHLHLYINGSSLMFGDPMPEQGCPLVPPQGFNLMLMVDDIESAFKRAVEAGAEVVMPVAKMFWGDTYAQVRDPFGITWAMNQQA